MSGVLYPGQEALLKFFECEHLPTDLRAVSEPFRDLALGLKAAALAGRIAPDAEFTTALRKLLEAKDCAVRAALGARR